MYHNTTSICTEEVWLSSNTHWSVAVFAEIQSNPSKWMAFAFGIAPASLELNPVGLINSRSGGNVIFVENFGIVPRRPGNPKAIDIIETWNTNESVFSGRCPESVGTFGSKKYRMIG